MASLRDSLKQITREISFQEGPRGETPNTSKSLRFILDKYFDMCMKNLKYKKDFEDIVQDIGRYILLYGALGHFFSSITLERASELIEDQFFFYKKFFCSKKSNQNNNITTKEEKNKTQKDISEPKKIDPKDDRAKLIGDIERCFIHNVAYWIHKTLLVAHALRCGRSIDRAYGWDFDFVHTTKCPLTVKTDPCYPFSIRNDLCHPLFVQSSQKPLEVSLKNIDTNTGGSLPVTFDGKPIKTILDGLGPNLPKIPVSASLESIGPLFGSLPVTLTGVPSNFSLPVVIEEPISVTTEGRMVNVNIVQVNGYNTKGAGEQHGGYVRL